MEDIVAASMALLERSGELIEHDKSAAVWNNIAFHAATVRMSESGCNVPTGPEAQAYIALVIATIESAEAQTKFENALKED